MTSRLRQTRCGQVGGDAVEVVGGEHDREPVALRSPSRCRTSWRVRTSTPDVGSSSSSRSGAPSSARAMNTRCCWPPDSSRMWRSARSPMPEPVEHRRRPRRRSARLRHGRRRPRGAGHQHALADGDREVPVDRLDLRARSRRAGPGGGATRAGDGAQRARAAPAAASSCPTRTARRCR